MWTPGRFTKDFYVGGFAKPYTEWVLQSHEGLHNVPGRFVKHLHIGIAKPPLYGRFAMRIFTNNWDNKYAVRGIYFSSFLCLQNSSIYSGQISSLLLSSQLIFRLNELSSHWITFGRAKTREGPIGIVRIWFFSNVSRGIMFNSLMCCSRFKAVIHMGNSTPSLLFMCVWNTFYTILMRNIWVFTFATNVHFQMNVTLLL